MNNLYLYSPMHVKANDIWSTYIQDLTYLELIKTEWIDKSQPGYCVSDSFDFLKAIELKNRRHGKINNLIIASEMWPYGINLCWGDPEGIVTIANFYEYPHNWDIENVKLIGLNINKKLTEDKETFVESLLVFVQGQITYYDEPFFRIGLEKEKDEIKRKLIGRFATISKNGT